ncbi:predicted protein [Chaetoceros tenuissimus]|nr:predicted protein [Chaetoceros tenuissimus]
MDEAMKNELASLISSSHHYVNEMIYTGRLQLNFKFSETEDAIPCPSYIEEVEAPNRTGTFRNQSKVSSGTQNKEEPMTTFDACWETMIQKRWIRNQYNDFVTLFKQDMNRKKSEHIAKSIIKADTDVTIYTLLNWFYEDKDELDELLKELGIEHRTDRRKVVSILSNLEKPEKSEPYLIARIDEEEFEEEQNIIRYKLLSSNYKGYFCVENDLSDVHIHLDKNETFKVLHFGLHKSTLEASDFNILLKENTSTSNIQCFVFNSCKSEEILKLAKEHLHNHNLIYWDSKVDDHAALRFSEEFYGRLCSRREKASKFEEIFEQTKEAMEAHDFVFEDPANRKDGVGILKFWNGRTSMDLEYADQTTSSKVEKEPSVSQQYDKKKRKLNDIEASEKYEISRTPERGDKKDYNCKQPYFCNSSKTINWCSQKNYTSKSNIYCSNCKVGFCEKVRTGCGGKSCFDHHLQTTTAIEVGVCRMENGVNEFKNGSAPRKSEFSVIGGHQCYPILVDEVNMILDGISDGRNDYLETAAQLTGTF